MCIYPSPEALVPDRPPPVIAPPAALLQAAASVDHWSQKRKSRGSQKKEPTYLDFSSLLGRGLFSTCIDKLPLKSVAVKNFHLAVEDLQPLG